MKFAYVRNVATAIFFTLCCAICLGENDPDVIASEDTGDNCEKVKLVDYYMKKRAPELEKGCQILLEKFSTAAANFTKCANNHAKPITMCRNCKNYYLDVLTYYEALSSPTEEGIKCGGIVTSQDRVEIISKTYSFIVGEAGLWTKGQCERCFEAPFTRNSSLTEETVKFFNLSASLHDCLNEFPPLINSTGERSLACDSCRDYYKNLSTFYKSNIFGKESPFLNKVCFDVLDSINMTRQLWGRDLNCGRKLISAPVMPAIIAICFILAMPFVFYISVRLLGDTARERVVIRPNIISEFLEENMRRIRSAGRLSRTSRSSGQQSGESTPIVRRDSNQLDEEHHED